MEKVLLGMSGGKDSTWACRVLQQRGYEVEGLLLVLHENAPIEEAKKSAERLGIKLHISDRINSFEEKVKRYFASEYLSGRTPNPCVECNSNIKFAALLDEADRLGIEKISTGHYVRAGKRGSRYTLSMADDTKKDQSYFLWQLGQGALSRFVSPLEDASRDDVIRNVLDARLMDSVKESQEICFVPDDDYIEFLKSAFTPEEAKKALSEGDFVNSEGKVMGRHRGYASYTVGQRKGLGVALGRPAFVLGISPEENRVILGFEEENACREFTADSLNFVSLEEFEGERTMYVRPRYRSPLIECRVIITGGRASVSCNTLIKPVSPGQSAVFYTESGELAFGGKICRKV